MVSAAPTCVLDTFFLQRPTGFMTFFKMRLLDMLTVDFLADLQLGAWSNWALSGWQQWLVWDQSWG